MKINRLSNSEVYVTELAFGAWAIGGWMWGGTDVKDSIKAIEAAIDNSMTTIDTAPVYGFGLSEQIVGEAIRGKRTKVQILTKYGLNWETKEGQFYFSSISNDGKPIDIYKYASKNRVIYECEQSLKRLNTDYIDLYQIHWPDPTTPIEETMEAIGRLIEQGKIRAAGVSNYSVEELKTALKVVPIVSDQVPYSMLKRDIEKDLIPFCLENNIAIIAYSPLQRGILTGKFSSDFNFKEGDHRQNLPWYKKENIIEINKFLDKLRIIANNYKVTLTQLALNWTIQQTGITCTLVGSRNINQTLENIKATEFQISQADIEYINKELNNLYQNLKL